MRVDNAPLRAAFLQGDKSLADVCRALEWTRSGGRTDTSRLRRTLGLMPAYSRGGSLMLGTVLEEVARTVCEALGRSFEEVYSFDAPTCAGCGEEIITGSLCGWCREELEGVAA